MLIGFDASRAFVAAPTGTENYSGSLLAALAKIDRKNRYRVFLRTTDYRLQTTDYPKNFQFVKIGPSRFWTQLGLALETWRHPVDLLFIPAHTLPLLRRRLAPGARETKTVVTIHDLGVEYLPGYHSFPGRYYLDLASKYAAHAADGLMAVSVATKKDLQTLYGVDPQRVFVVAEGVDINFFRPRSEKEVKNVKIKYQIEGNYFLFVGTVQPRKNLVTLIQAFSKLVYRLQTSDYRLKSRAVDGRQWPVDLVVAGKLGWDYQDILAASRNFGVERQVRFLNYVERVDLPALYSGALILTAPSLFEGFDLPILEALACGCRVVASDILPHQEIYREIAGSAALHPRPTSSLKQNPAELEISAPYAAGARRRSPSRVTRKTTRLQTTNYELRTILEAMILLKPNDIEGWVSVLYQSISQNNRSWSVAAIRGELKKKFSWEVAAKKTLGVFEKVSSID